MRTSQSEKKPHLRSHKTVTCSAHRTQGNENPIGHHSSRAAQSIGDIRTGRLVTLQATHMSEKGKKKERFFLFVSFWQPWCTHTHTHTYILRYTPWTHRRKERKRKKRKRKRDEWTPLALAAHFHAHHPRGSKLGFFLVSSTSCRWQGVKAGKRMKRRITQQPTYSSCSCVGTNTDEQWYSISPEFTEIGSDWKGRERRRWTRTRRKREGRKGRGLGKAKHTKAEKRQLESTGCSIWCKMHYGFLLPLVFAIPTLLFPFFFFAPFFFFSFSVKYKGDGDWQRNRQRDWAQRKEKKRTRWEERFAMSILVLSGPNGVLLEAQEPMNEHKQMTPWWTTGTSKQASDNTKKKGRKKRGRNGALQQEEIEGMKGRKTRWVKVGDGWAYEGGGHGGLDLLWCDIVVCFTWCLMLDADALSSGSCNRFSFVGSRCVD